MTDPGITLVVRKTIPASAQRLFTAWTEPDQLRRWWGPDGVVCVDPEIDLRLGGRYRIGNRLPNGSVVWIAGEFETIEPPRRLVFTWRVEGTGAAVERVTVSFEEQGGVTEVIVTHARIDTEAVRDQHRHGWEGCLGGLARYITTPAA